MLSLFLHYCIGLAGAGAGWYARGFCKHLHHRVILTLALVLVEAIASVRIVG